MADYEVATIRLNIRDMPGIGGTVIGYLENGSQFSIEDVREVNGELWGHLGGYVALRYHGLHLVDDLRPPEPVGGVKLEHWPTLFKQKSIGGNPYGPQHKAVDLYAPIDSPIYSVAPGRVMLVDYKPDGYGEYTMIQHDGYTTLYAHMRQPAHVGAGQEVRAGYMIGVSGATGNVYPSGNAGAHLHFELCIDGDCVDPWPYLQAI